MAITKDIIAQMLEKEVPKSEKIEIGEYEINVTKLIPPSYAGMIVDNVVEGCFGNEGKYDPIRKDALLRMFVITVYTDIDLPDDFDEAYAFIYHTGVYDVIAPHINQMQLDEITSAIDDSIEYRLSVSTNAIETSLVSLQGELATALTQLKGVYDGINPGDIKALMSAMSNTKLDEGKLVEAIIDKTK